jgi:hypothetical protein
LALQGVYQIKASRSRAFIEEQWLELKILREELAG